MNADYLQAESGLTFLNSTTIDYSTSRPCKNGGPGLVYSIDLDALSINSNGTVNNRKFYLTGNSSKALSIRTLELKSNTNLVLMDMTTLNITSNFKTGMNTTISLGNT